MKNDGAFMREALKEARAAASAGELPVGCVAVLGGEIVARAHNECEARRDATAHAELLAIQRASAARGDWRLKDVTLYVTLEPCPMCAGAMVQARVGRLVFGAPNPARAAPEACTAFPRTPPFPTSAPQTAAFCARNARRC